ncbi:hypothetical protein G7046_g2631 [Stylonectria norvegica]|nr:hypothetical protein G7046_g2631 [Stylonectria norvegica]
MDHPVLSLRQTLYDKHLSTSLLTTRQVQQLALSRPIHVGDRPHEYLRYSRQCWSVLKINMEHPPLTQNLIQHASTNTTYITATYTLACSASTSHAKFIQQFPTHPPVSKVFHDDASSLNKWQKAVPKVHIVEWTLFRALVVTDDESTLKRRIWTKCLRAPIYVPIYPFDYWSKDSATRFGLIWRQDDHNGKVAASACQIVVLTVTKMGCFHSKDKKGARAYDDNVPVAPRPYYKIPAQPPKKGAPTGVRRHTPFEDWGGPPPKSILRDRTKPVQRPRPKGRKGRKGKKPRSTLVPIPEGDAEV